MLGKHCIPGIPLPASCFLLPAIRLCFIGWIALSPN